MLKLIAHRGNINGIHNYENDPVYVSDMIDRYCFDAEIDVWFVGGILYLGHDYPRYKIRFEYLDRYKNNLWLHCKNIEALFVLPT